MGAGWDRVCWVGYVKSGTSGCACGQGGQDNVGHSVDGLAKGRIWYNEVGWEGFKKKVSY